MVFPVVMYGCESWTIKKAERRRIYAFELWCWESLGLQGDPSSSPWRKSVLNIHWKDWCWSSNTLATWCKELTLWKRPWYWERLKVGGGWNDRGWDGRMTSPTGWTWLWVSSGSWWWTGKPGVLQSTGSQRVRHGWVTELNWTCSFIFFFFFLLERTMHWRSLWGQDLLFLNMQWLLSLLPLD